MAWGDEVAFERLYERVAGPVLGLVQREQAAASREQRGDTLTGGYVLNTLAPEENETFARHIAHCPSCAAEVAELRETVARLGSAVARQPSGPLRERDLAEVARTRQLPRRSSP